MADSTSGNRILQDHVRRGKLFIPPIIASAKEHGTDLQEVDWQGKMLPELLWLALLVVEQGYDKAIGMAEALVNEAGIIQDWKFSGSTGTISMFSTLTPTQSQLLRSNLKATQLLRPLQATLLPLVKLFPKCPLSKIYSSRRLHITSDEAASKLEPVVRDCMFRRDRLPMLAQAVCWELTVRTGRISFAKGLRIPPWDAIKDYPETEESENAAGFIRAMLGNIGMFPKTSEWPEYFWEVAKYIGPCVPIEKSPFPPFMLAPEFTYYNMSCFKEYSESCNKLWARILKRPTFRGQSLRSEVLLGLASRSYRLTVQLASFSINWTEDVSQAFLRMVLESYIYFRWFSNVAGEEDFSQFYEHGLGQQKLFAEHIKNFLENAGVAPEDMEDLNPGLEFLRQHKLPMFVSVNVGAVIQGKNLRKIAEEADCKQEYSLMYSPTSSVVHGMYDALDSYYLTTCINPLHRFHKVPYYWTKSPLTLYGLFNCLQLTDVILADLSRMTGIREPATLPGRRYCDRLINERRYKRFSSQEDVIEKSNYHRQQLREAMEDG